MSKKHESESATQEAAAEAQTEAVTAATATPAAAEVSDDRYKKLTLDATGSTFAYGDDSKAGVVINRIDFIRAAWQVTKKSRGDIARELTRLAGKKVTYQIVFAATKALPGGPAKAEPAPAPAAEGQAVA